MAGFWNIADSVLGGLGDTFAKTAVAYVLSIVLGVGGGILLGSMRRARDVLNDRLSRLAGVARRAQAAASRTTRHASRQTG